MTRGHLLATAVTAAALGATVARADTYDFANLTPTDGSTISYANWFSAGGYVSFTIMPDSNHPCGSEYYFLEVNGRRVAQFSSACSASVYLPTPGRYSWRTILYVFETATTVTGSQVSTFTVAPASATPVAPTTTSSTTPSTTIPREPADTISPKVSALQATLTAGKSGHVRFRVSDNSGVASVALGVYEGKAEVWSKVYRSAQADAPSPVFFATWRPSRVGRYSFCVLAQDAAGNHSRASCATVTVR
jgi:hypothetical protein